MLMLLGPGRLTWRSFREELHVKMQRLELRGHCPAKSGGVNGIPDHACCIRSLFLIRRAPYHGPDDSHLIQTLQPEHPMHASATSILSPLHGRPVVGLDGGHVFRSSLTGIFLAVNCRVQEEMKKASDQGRSISKNGT